MIEMRDGVKMATDIYRPSLNGKLVTDPLPIILERTPYGKHLPSRTEVFANDLTNPKTREEVAEIFVKRGYIVVYQDTRGRYNSEGKFSKYLDDAEDGYDTCAWLVKQDWCNGKIGTKGFSYAAHTQAALASLNAPGLAAMFVDSGGFSNSYQGGIRQGGAFELKQATWAFRNAQESPEIANDPEKKKAFEEIDLKEWFKKMPWQKGNSPLSIAPEYESYLFEQWSHGNFDDYWKQAGIYAEGFYQDFPDIPQLYMSAWYDPYPRTASENYIGLSKTKKSPIYLVLGPWIHGTRSRSYHGEVDFGKSAILDNSIAKDYFEFRLSFFDYWLKGIKNDFQNESKVKIFVMGGGSGKKNSDGRLEHGGYWKKGNDYPFPGTKFTKYFLDEKGLLSAQNPPKKVKSLTYQYDPKNPVPTIGGAITSGRPLMEGGAYHQKEGEKFYGSKEPYQPISERKDILVFQTPVLEKDIEIAGPIESQLWISSDCPDTDFTIKLIDVYPPSDDYPEGFAMNLTDGIIRVRYRNSWEKPEWMKPGQVYPIKIEAFPTANLFKKGHKIRIDISSSNFPHFDLNFNTGEPEGQATHSKIANNTIYLGDKQASYISLPITSI